MGTVRPRGKKVIPLLESVIRDSVSFHNTSVACWGRYTVTVNGGNWRHGMVNLHTGDELDTSYSVWLDSRTVFYCRLLDRLCVKPYGRDLYVLDPSTGIPYVHSSNLFRYDNSSVGASSSGRYVFELNEGQVHVTETTTGFDMGRLTLQWPEGDTVELPIGTGDYGRSCAASWKYLFTWNRRGDVFVHDLEGRYVTRFRLPVDGPGYTLSWCGGMLWAAEDADADELGGIGTWYGYRLKGLE